MIKAAKVEKMITLEEAIKNPRLLRGLKKECFTCDPYNPVRKERANCPECKGTGFSPADVIGIVADLKKGRKDLNARTAAYYDED